MKRIISLILVCVLLPAAVYAAGAKKENDYITIKEAYERAVAAQESENFDLAINELKGLVEYYENSADPEIDRYSDAQKYYSYAKARVELVQDDPDYSEAVNQLGKCDDTFYLKETYRQYALGMIAMQNRDYPGAVSGFRAAAELKEFTSQIYDAIDACKKEYKAETIAKAQSACTAGEHETAQGYYSDFQKVFDDDDEINRLLLECKQHSSGDMPVTASSGRIQVSGAVNGQELAVNWTDSEEGHRYTVAVYPENGKELDGQPVSVSSYTYGGLIPGTVYIARVIDAEDAAQYGSCQIEVPKAPEMNRDSLIYIQTELRCIEKQFYTLLNPKEIKDSDLASPKSAAVSAQDAGKNVFFCRSSFAYKADEEITVSVWNVLRTGQHGVWKTEEQQVFTPSPTNGALVLTNLSPLLDQVKGDWSDLPVDEYIYEIYIDGELCGSCHFSITEGK